MDCPIGMINGGGRDGLPRCSDRFVQVTYRAGLLEPGPQCDCQVRPVRDAVRVLRLAVVYGVSIASMAWSRSVNLSE